MNSVYDKYAEMTEDQQWRYVEGLDKYIESEWLYVANNSGDKNKGYGWWIIVRGAMV